MRLRIEHDGNVNTAWTLGDPDRTAIALKYIVEAYEGEPLLCLRGRDWLALPTATYYRALLDQHLGDIQGPVVEGVKEDMRALVAWSAANRRLMKYPDRPVR